MDLGTAHKYLPSSSVLGPSPRQPGTHSARFSGVLGEQNVSAAGADWHSTLPPHLLPFSGL